MGIPCGFEEVADLETARSRLGQLASANPGEYFVFDLTAKHVLVSPVSTDEISSIMRFCDMKLDHYDIVRQEDDKSAIWLEAVSDLNTAQCRIQELVSLWPGQFQVVDQQSLQIIARVNGLPNHGEPMVD